MLFGHLALAAAALFAGAAIYVSAVEQPARLGLDPRSLLMEWQPAYQRGALMQASLAVVGFLLGLAAWWQTGRLAFALGALLLIANWPWTLLRIKPLNDRLKATDPATASDATRAQIVEWGHLHAMRTGLGAASALVFLWAVN